MSMMGGETMVIGEAAERVSALNGLRVRSISDDECGVIYNVYVNTQTKVAQIWVNMDSGGARCFRPYHLSFSGFAVLPTGKQAKLLEVMK